MSFTVKWSENSLKQLRKLDRHVARRIIRTVDDAKENPYRNIKKIIGSKDFRLRVGDYRIFVSIERNEINVLKISHRRTAYKN